MRRVNPNEFRPVWKEESWRLYWTKLINLDWIRRNWSQQTEFCTIVRRTPCQRFGSPKEELLRPLPFTTYSTTRHTSKDSPEGKPFVENQNQRKRKWHRTQKNLSECFSSTFPTTWKNSQIQLITSPAIRGTRIKIKQCNSICKQRHFILHR